MSSRPDGKVVSLPTAAARCVRQPEGWFRDQLDRDLPRFSGKYMSPAERAWRAERGFGRMITVEVDEGVWNCFLELGQR